ncbi:hypothetical protein CSKR_113168, partial [Clonorchis sinensis]
MQTLEESRVWHKPLDHRQYMIIVNIAWILSNQFGDGLDQYECERTNRQENTDKELCCQGDECKENISHAEVDRFIQSFYTKTTTESTTTTTESITTEQTTQAVVSTSEEVGENTHEVPVAANNADTGTTPSPGESEPES